MRSPQRFFLLPRAFPRLVLFSALLLLFGCDEGADVTGPVSTASSSQTVAGTVLDAATGAPVTGAEVTIGPRTSRTGSDGRFELSGLVTGPATLQCTASGFEGFEEEIIVGSERTAREIRLSPVVGSLEVAPRGLAVSVGFAKSLTATVKDTNGRRIPDPDVVFTSDDEGVAVVRYDETNGYPNPKDVVSIVGVGPGTATITAEHKGITDRVTVTVSASLDLGVYDLTATVTASDPAWGLGDLRYTAVVALYRIAADSPQLGGVFSDWRVDYGTEQVTVAPDGSGLATGSIRPGREIAIQVDRLWWAMQGIVLDSGDIEGTFGCCGHISGTFTAKLRRTP